MSEESNALEKLKSIEDKLIKKYGANYFAISRDRKVDPVNFISTGCYSLDYVLGGGIPEGRVIQLFGQESTGKTAITLQTIASFQSQGKVCAFIDAESTYDPIFASNFGVDSDKLAIVRGDDAEENLEALRDLTKSGFFSLIVLDSVAALVPKEVKEKGIDESTMAILARYMSKLLPELINYCSKNKCSLIFINQIRASMKLYGNPESVTGGNALKYYCSSILKTTKKKPIEKDGTEVGITIEIKGTKNKCAPPFRAKEINIIFPHESTGGIDIFNDIVTAALDKNIINRSGAFYSFNGIKTQGKDKMIEELKNNNELFNDLKERLYSNEHQDLEAA